jgi:alkylhydroperoxidase family enzyme
MLTRLVTMFPYSPEDAQLVALVRVVCARTLALPPLPVPAEIGGAESAPQSEKETVVAEFAEQFSADVSAITPEQRSRLWKQLGEATFGVVVHMYLADFIPRVRAGLESLGVGSHYLDWVTGPIAWDYAGDPSEVVFNDFLPAVARIRALDPVTAELVRLRGATQHNCRLCKTMRDITALNAGGSEELYGDLDRYETSPLLDDRTKAALRYTDALLWTPAHLDADDVAEVRSAFTEDEAVDLTLCVMRNASNKVAVSLGADAPRVQDGTELYRIDADGQTVYG